MSRFLTRFYRLAGLPILAAALLSLFWVVPNALSVLGNNQNNVVEWLPAGFQETKDLVWFVERFGSDEILAVSWPGCTVDTPSLRALEEQLLQPPAAGEPPLFRRVFHGPQVLELLETSLKLSREQALQRMSGWLVGPDGKTSCAVAIVSEAGQADRHRAVETLYEAVEAACGVPRSETRVGGPTVDSVAIDRASNTSLYEMIALAFLLSLIVAWFALRSLLLTGLVFASAVYCQLMTLNLMHWAGQPMNSVLIMVPTLVYVLAIAASIHLVNYLLDAAPRVGWQRATAHAILVSFAPCSLAAVTDAIGVGSLAVSNLVPIQKFGVFAAAGTLTSLALLFLIVPSALEWMQPILRRRAARLEAKKAKGGSDHLEFRALSRFVVRYSTSIVVVSLLGIVLLTVASQRIESAVKLKTLFRSDAEVMQSYAWIEEHIGPLVPVEIVLRFPDAGSAAPLDRLRLTDAVQRRVAQIEGVGGLISTATFAPPVPQGSGAGSSTVRTMIRRNLAKRHDELLATGYLAETGTEQLWRITARVPAMSDVDYGAYVDSLRRAVDETLLQSKVAQADNVQAVLCGGIPVFNSASTQLLKDLQSSFASAFLLIGASMFLLIWIGMVRQGAAANGTLGSFVGLAIRNLPGAAVAAVVAMLPNVFPVVAVFGVMGWFGWKVDIGAMMTASVALGIAVDDTLHFLTWFQRSLAEGKGRLAATLAAYRHCTASAVQMTMICTLGLVAFAPSEFIPIARFSWLMVASLWTALAGDMIMLPALLISPLGKAFSWGLRKPVQPAESRSVRSPAPEPASAVQ